MKVNLIYFKQTGKFFSEGTYETEKEHLFQIFTEVREKTHSGDLPGLIKGHSEFLVSIDVPDHPHRHPHLITHAFCDCRNCKWTVDEDGVFDTGCNNRFEFIEGGPEENRFTHCPYCGGKLEVYDSHN